MQVVKNLGFQYLPKGSILFKAGDKGDKFYVILRGLVGVYITLPSKDNPKEFNLTKIAEIAEGNGFGEVALQ